MRNAVQKELERLTRQCETGRPDAFCAAVLVCEAQCIANKDFQIGADCCHPEQKRTSCRTPAAGLACQPCSNIITQRRQDDQPMRPVSELHWGLIWPAPVHDPFNPRGTCAHAHQCSSRARRRPLRVSMSARQRSINCTVRVAAATRAALSAGGSAFTCSTCSGTIAALCMLHCHWNRPGQPVSGV